MKSLFTKNTIFLIIASFCVVGTAWGQTQTVSGNNITITGQTVALNQPITTPGSLTVIAGGNINAGTVPSNSLLTQGGPTINLSSSLTNPAIFHSVQIQGPLAADLKAPIAAPDMASIAKALSATTKEASVSSNVNDHGIVQASAAMTAAMNGSKAPQQLTQFISVDPRIFNSAGAQLEAHAVVSTKDGSVELK